MNPAPTTPDAVRLDARERSALLEECRDLVLNRVGSAVGDVLSGLSEELATRALDAREESQRQAFLEAVGVVRQHRSEIELRFRQAFAEIFERRLFGRPESASPDPAGPPSAPLELSLVDDSVIQARMESDRLVRRVRDHLDPEEVLGVRARIGVLLERGWIDEHLHPLAPEGLFEALRQALDAVVSADSVRAALLESFSLHLHEPLNAIHVLVNERLRAHQILPRIRAQVEVSGRTSPRGPAAAGVAAGPAVGYGHGGFPGEGGAGHGPAIDASGWQALMAQLSRGHQGARASAARMLANPQSFDTTQQVFPTAELPLLDTLGELQSAALAVSEITPEFIARVAERAREKGSPLDQLTVDIVSMVFDYLYADKSLADSVKQQLLRLQVVAIKAALLDRSFFARRQHPMRRLLDRVSEVAADPDADLGPQAPLTLGIAVVVDELVASFSDDLAMFDQARQRIEELVADETARRLERLERLTREAQHAEELTQARDLARARLGDRLDADTPEFVRHFLESCWTQVLAQGKVDGERAAIDYDKGIELAEALIWSVALKYPEEVQRLAGMLPGLIAGLMRGARAVGVAEDVRVSFFNELLETHTRLINGARQAAAVRRKPSNLRLRPDGQVQFSQILPPVLLEPSGPRTAESRSILLGELRRGDSIEVLSNDGEFRPWKISWISPAQKVYVLSRFPDKARSLERVQMAALFDSGRARRVVAGQAVERAIDQWSGAQESEEAVAASL